VRVGDGMEVRREGKNYTGNETDIKNKIPK
jgi:hypothetical protein